MIFVCGDTHNIIDYEKLTSKEWSEGKLLNKNDYLIILGDVGLVWYGEKTRKENYLINWYNEKPWTTLFIDGNHENFDRLFSDEFKKINMFGSEVKQISDSIFYLQRGHVYKIDGKTFFTFGGGYSIDKNSRIEHIDWWSQEIPNYEEMDLGIKNLYKCKKHVDFILTHSCSNEMFDIIDKRFDLSYKRGVEKGLRNYFSWIELNVNFKQWHFGHYHDDFKVDEKHFLHFDNKPMRIN